jgi:hypothetical protein
VKDLEPPFHSDYGPRTEAAETLSRDASEIVARPRSNAWWPWLRISVRGLIVSVLLVGGGLGWIVHQARIQRDAVAAIVKSGDRVQYDWQWRD